MNDTPPEIRRLLRERLLARSGSERVQMGSEMFELARLMAIASFPSHISSLETKVRLCKRFYGDEVNITDFIRHLEEQGRS